MPISVAVDDLLEFKLKGFFDNAVEVNNIFHYHVSAVTTATLDNFAAGLWATLATVLLPRTAAEVTYDLVDARIVDADGALVNSEVFVIAAGTGDGAEGGDSLPPTDTWTFKLLRPDGSFRHGFKRFAGVAEAAQSKGLPTAGVISSLTAIASMLSAPVQAQTITGGVPAGVISGNTMHPVIFQKVINGDPVSPMNVGDITAAVFSRIGSQDTRAYGRGS
jgi:hypothetical protein